MTDKMPTLTVKELIELLKTQPQNAPVWIEGCDCINPAVGVAMQKPSRGAADPPYLLIEARL